MGTTILFGGAGYIGQKWAWRLATRGKFDRIVLADMRRPNIPMPARVEFIQCDVRKAIRRQLEGIHPEWIFNFAAIHREPGHEPTEYFDTNLAGAKNVCEFADGTRCARMLFTSSIAVYGPTRGATTETSPTYPTTPYGISKLCAEFIHDAWLREQAGRRLVICRPGVVYGPGDPGNILRMIRAIQRGYFFFPGSTSIRKSYGYIEGLLDSFEFAMNCSERVLRYNYVESETETIGEMVRIIRGHLGSAAPVISVPSWLLQPVASGMQFLTRGKSPIHPARVRKAATPTHIVPQTLRELGFHFSYDFRSSLNHWTEVCPQDFSRSAQASQPVLRPARP